MEINKTDNLLLLGFSLILLIYLFTVTMNSRTHISKHSLLNSLKNII